MTPPRDREAVLLALALEKPADKRPAFLDAVCEGDPALRQRLEALLAARQKPDQIEARQTIRVEPLDSESAPQTVGALIGGYHLLRPLGRGGMGAVYEAEEIESGRRVALKVLSQTLDSPVARRRFLREGLLAASINHPNTVYVFGTDEIDGVPLIAMELVSGGTLQDRIQQNQPMSVAETVDTILQVIAGLEAAAARGVLHRDIKPSNCFVETNGTVKVGDFGLAFSSAGDGEPKLTMTGSFLGTPAFSPPEQLRGDEFTVQGDIYAVGVTFYYLLTGRTPFQGEDLVRMLATVLERPPESPAKVRPGLPNELCRAVLRCLEKQPAKRFRNYSELRAALLPYGSAAPTPATLNLRFLAGFIDWILFDAAHFFMMLLAPGHWDLLFHTENYPGTKLFVSILITALALVYYSVLEGRWGASLGKRICGLRVTGLNRGLPGVPRALLRAAIAVGLPQVPMLLFLWFSFWPHTLGATVSLSKWMPYSALVIGALLFCTGRRRNGYAAAQDLLSRTQVIRQSAHEGRPGLAGVADPFVAAEAATPRLGPYQILETLERNEAGNMLLGFDTRLLRKVWIRKLPAGSPPVTTALHHMARVGRLRWLNGKRSTVECWDAYEALPGMPLADLINRRQSWDRVRFWLLDLAEELSAAAKDQSLPTVLDPDRVWITADGRAKLLDFPAPRSGTRVDQPEHELAGEALIAGSDPQGFLCQVAAAALEGRRATAADARSSSMAVPLPPHARILLGELQSGLSPSLLAERIKPLLSKLAFVSLRRRMALIAGCVVFTLVVAGILAVVVLAGTRLAQTPSEAAVLGQCLDRWTELGTTHKPTGGLEGDRAIHDREAFEVYLAGHFRSAITNPATWTSLAGASVPPEQRIAAERLVARRPAPTDLQRAQAAGVVEPWLKMKSAEFAGLVKPLAFNLMSGVSQSAWMTLSLSAVGSLLAALLFRGGLVLRTLGLTIVKKDGTEASRLRIFWRSLIAWSPVLLLPTLWTSLFLTFQVSRAERTLVMSVVLVLEGVLVVWTALLPERGLHDRLAGTCLAPRE